MRSRARPAWMGDRVFPLFEFSAFWSAGLGDADCRSPQSRFRAPGGVDSAEPDLLRRGR